MFKLIYLLLKQRLQEIPDPQNPTQPLCVAWYNGAYILDAEEPPFNLPCNYIEFLPADTESVKKKIQKSTLSFRVHTVTENYADDDSALNHLDLVNEVYDTLHGHSAMLSDLAGAEHVIGTPEDQVVYNTISRRNIQPDHKQTNLIVTIQTFQTLAFDLSASPVYNKIKPLLHVKLVIT